MDLESLVTEALGGEEEAPRPSPMEIISNNIRMSPGPMAEVIEQGIASIEADAESAWETVTEIVAYQLSSSRFGSNKISAMLLLHASEASQSSESRDWVLEKLRTMRGDLRASESAQRRSAAIGSWGSALDFLSSLFGEETVSTLASVTGAKPPTVRRWLSGGAAKWGNTLAVQRLAEVLWRMIEEQGRKEEDALAWFFRDLHSGKSPYELWGQGRWRLVPELDEEIKRQGITLGR